MDVVIVGAGPAGWVVAERLRARGLDAIIVEAGQRVSLDRAPPEVDRRAWAYRAEGGSFDWYRVRAVGGRSLLWGGWSYRFPDRVLRRAGLPSGRAALDREYAAIERALYVVEGSVDERYARAARALGLSVLPKRAPLRRDGRPWIPFARGDRALRTCHVALRLEHEGGRARAIACLDLATGAEVRLAARAFVLAASPIETARLVLGSDLPPSRVGRGLVDHLVASYVLIEPRPAPPPPRRRFPGSALFESFVNVSRSTRRPYRGGFSIEVVGPVPLETLGVERMVADDERASHCATQIHALGELGPHTDRFVALDGARRDALGRAIPIVHVAWSDEDVALATDMKRACVTVADAFAAPGSRLVPFVEPLAQLGAGHEAGTCAMGGRDAPCDATGRLRALANVWIADASALASAGDRHPTLTVLAHARRAATALADRNER